MTSHETSRRLATILAADVVGYSRLMADDEDATVHTLQAYREIIDRLIARHEGRIFNTAGDSVLAEFGSAVEAVRCAITIQDELRVRNAEVDESRRMLFRIGINIGDVIVDGDNLLGDGINVAARLESIAVPGGVCISGGTFEQVKNKLSVGFEDLGPQAVKNIPDPVAAFRITGAPVSVSATDAAGSAPTRRTAFPGRTVIAGVVVVAVAAAAWLLRSREAAPPSTPEQTLPQARVVPSPAATAESEPTPNPQPKAVPTPRPAERPTPEPEPVRPPPATVAAPPISTPMPVRRISTRDLAASEIAALLTGMTIRGTRQKDGQPFTIDLHEGGHASYSFPRSGSGAGTTFRANGRWRAEDGLFCMQFRGFNHGEEACPVISREGTRIAANRPNGESLDWTLARTAPGTRATVPNTPPTSSDEMRADEIAALVSGMTLNATRQRDGRPFTIELHPGGRAEMTLERPGKPPFRETGKWWSEDYLFCTQFTNANQGEPICPRIVRKGQRLTLTKGDGTPLNWTLTR